MNFSVAPTLLGLLLLTASRDPARAADSPDDDPNHSSRANPATSAARGGFLPLSHAATIETQGAIVTGLTGYDGARHAGSFEAMAELRLWGPLALRGGAVYTNAGRTVRPAVGLRAQGLREGRHGIDAAFGVFYRPEGLTEPEGEIESVLSIGRHVGATYLLGGLLYGQDPEANERDGEIRLAALQPLGGRVFVGLDSRLRFDLGSRTDTLVTHGEPKIDALVGPLATTVIGPCALSVQAGASALRLAGQSSTKAGVFVLGGAGLVF